MARILTVTNWYPPHHYGGYELSCFDVMTRLEARGHDVRVLCSDQRLPEATEPTAHEAVVERSLRLFHTGEDLYVPGLRERRAIARHDHQRLAAVLDAFRPDVVSAWHLAALPLGMMGAAADRGVPVVHAVCDEWPGFGVRLDQWGRLFEGRPRLGRLVAPLAGVPTTVPDLGALGPALYVTDDLRQRVRARTRFGFTDEAVVYSGIDRATYPPRPATDRPWRWRLLATGRFDPRKGFETAIRALAHLPAEATLTVHGRGGEAERARLLGVAEAVGVADRVALSSLERHEMPAAYEAADAFVFPSEWDEPFGLVPVEAMACGTPVIATGVGGSAEFLRHGHNCLLFPPGDPVALAARVRQLADSPGARRPLVEAGLRTAEELGVDRLADVMEAWHLHACGQAPRPEARRLGSGAGAAPGPALDGSTLTP